LDAVIDWQVVYTGERRKMKFVGTGNEEKFTGNLEIDFWK
jgi:hypothetical protein